MDVHPYGTLADAEAAERQMLKDLSDMTLAQLAALVFRYDAQFSGGQSEEALFIAACGDEEEGRKAHKRYLMYPKEEDNVRAFCVARLRAIFKKILAAAPSSSPDGEFRKLKDFLATPPAA